MALEKIYGEPLPGEVVDVGSGRKQTRSCGKRNRAQLTRLQTEGTHMTPWERYFLVGRRAGCPKDQMDRFQAADVILQERQLAASARRRGCATGPTGRRPVGYGGARGGGKSRTGCWRRWAWTTASACRA